MNYSVRNGGDRCILSIEGELDAVTAPALRDAIDSLVTNHSSEIMVDLSGLRMIDSSGVGAIVSLYKRARARGREVWVTGLSEQPLAIFRLLKLDGVLSREPTNTGPV